jgi:hypothetical protein
MPGLENRPSIPTVNIHDSGHGDFESDSQARDTSGGCADYEIETCGKFSLQFLLQATQKCRLKDAAHASSRQTEDSKGPTHLVAPQLQDVASSVVQRHADHTTDRLI